MVKLFSSRSAGQHFTAFERGILSAAIAVAAFAWITSYLAAQKRAIHTAKEAVLREDCRVVRQAIDAYTVDLQKTPNSLTDLIQSGYLKALPKDFSLEACK
jgi:general secretion pathway protein G